MSKFEQLSVEWFVYINVDIVSGNVLSVRFEKQPVEEKVESKLAIKLKKDLERYFSGKRVEFNYPVCFEYTNFVSKVLNETKKVPYGSVVTYGELARRLNTNAYRAVGKALAINRTPILIPCHRVVSKRGLGGYSAGIEIKRELLRLEGVI